MSELKAQNAAEEQARIEAQQKDAAIQDDQNDDVDDTDPADNDDDTDTDIDPDPDGNPDDDGEKLEAWQRSDDKSVPLSAHVKTKHKLKGRLSEKDDEIEKLKAKIAEMEKGNTISEAATSPQLKRPDEFNFDSDEEYQKALDEYESQRFQSRFDLIEKQRQAQDYQRQAQAKLTEQVDKHYERAEKLVSDSGIDPDVYRNADITVRQAIENVAPKQGDIITDQLISILGDGSEKVMYYLGRNKPVLNEFLVLLNEDRSGIKASAFLGETKARLVTPKKRNSNARPPATKIKGDAPSSGSSKRLMKAYQEAHKKGDSQAAYNAKKEARALKIDVSNW